MSTDRTALLVIDVQESFQHRPYWNDHDVPLFMDRIQALIDGANARDTPVVQIFHVEESGAFSVASGHVKTHGKQWSPEEIKARTELLLDERFARIVSVEEALAREA